MKNKNRGERKVAISDTLATILRDHIDEYRHDVTDEYGREPLLTTEFGRLTDNTLRAYVYRWTRPCAYGNQCPYDRNPDDCEAMEARMSASKCPDSVAPHAIRRGAITHYLAEDTPAKVVSDRMNVSQDVIDEHYDHRSEREKMEQRREFLNRL